MDKISPGMTLRVIRIVRPIGICPGMKAGATYVESVSFYSEISGSEALIPEPWVDPEDNSVNPMSWVRIGFHAEVIGRVKIKSVRR